MERIGIYGGTFNPPHLGHFRAAEQAVEALRLDKLLMIPDRIAPHKALPVNSPAPMERLEMVRMGIGDCAKVQVSDLELNRQGPSYTYETVEQLRSYYPQAELFLLMGTDMFLSFDAWRYPQRIWQQASLAVLYRGDRDERTAVEAQKAKLESLGARVVLINNPVLAISSTDLRRMLIFRCAGEYLPGKVASYIYEHGLYGTGKDYRGLSLEELEQVVVSLLKPSRVAHVLGCRQTAVELARRYGADETDAARAALLHDITKALDGPLQLTLCREYGTMLNAFSVKNPKTLHALTGSLVAERIFWENPAVVDAIACHTTGKANMNLLEKIIYVADYMEPNRDFSGVEALRSLAYTDISKALKLGLQMTLDMLRRQGREISPESLDALGYLETAGV
ncbi:MAG: nicotinate (nicotinamide) nucleotide adenylyltransferase [Oscillospiraceae bacterium]|nr:nicotinate (nicotinamide) nucleotide adenylyltransferase [Oscillospiraceae bacterium]